MAELRRPYPFSSTMLPSLINARAAPGTLCVDMRRSISASESEKSAADTEAASVPTTTAIPTALIASGRPHRLRFIVLAPIITVKFEGAPCGRSSQPSRRGRVLRAADGSARVRKPDRKSCGQQAAGSPSSRTAARLSRPLFHRPKTRASRGGDRDYRGVLSRLAPNIYRGERSSRLPLMRVRVI